MYFYGLWSVFFKLYLVYVFEVGLLSFMRLVIVLFIDCIYLKQIFILMENLLNY